MFAAIRRASSSSTPIPCCDDIIRVVLFHGPDLLRKSGIMVDPPDPQFELIGSDGLFNGLRHLRYGAGHDDPAPFTLTLTPQYVAREIKKALPVSYLKVQRYAERNADKLKAKAKFEKERGFKTHTLE
jgi:hypothetical protein